MSASLRGHNIFSELYNIQHIQDKAPIFPAVADAMKWLSVAQEIPALF